MRFRLFDVLIGDRGNPFTSLLAWMVFVVVFATPGLFMAAGGNANPLGLVTGLFFFILAYWFPLQVDEVRNFCKRQTIRKTLRIGYWSLLALYVFVPIGFPLTMVVGSVATNIAGVGNGGASFAGANAARVFAATVFHGLILRLGLSVYMAFVYLGVRSSREKTVSGSTCSNCGYDLRASPVRCPECGAPVPTQES